MSEGLLDGCKTGSILGRDDKPKKQKVSDGPPDPPEAMVPMVLALPASEANRLASLATEEGVGFAELLHRRLSGVGIRQAKVLLWPALKHPETLAGN